MSRYRKRPIEVEAMQVTPATIGTIVRDWLTLEAFSAASGINGDMYVEVRTHHGVARADEGDWIIRGLEGEFYPCKANVFAETYEPVDGGTP